MANQDPYFLLPEISNSDVGSVDKLLNPRKVEFDPTEAFKFGTLVDAIITEPEYVDYYKRTCHGEIYKKEDFHRAVQMKKAFMKDDICRSLFNVSEFQRVDRERRSFIHDGLRFDMDMKCKWDMYSRKLGWGSDIKSTTATTQKQFVAACHYFNYPRQRAWYMHTRQTKRDMLIGISKVNFKVFRIPIEYGDAFHTEGWLQMNRMAFQYNTFFGGFSR